MAMAGQVTPANDLDRGNYRRAITKTIQLGRVIDYAGPNLFAPLSCGLSSVKAGQLSAEGLRYVATGYVGRLSRAMPDVPKLPQCSILRM